MKEVSLRENGLMVVDNVLPASTFSALCCEVAHGDYHWVHSKKWDKAWRLWDGQVLRGESVYFDPECRVNWKGANYPTSTSVDLLIDTVRHLSASCPEIAGRESEDWYALYLSPWLYPVGSALSLHEDGNRYTGAFTFFTHSRWSVHWGGELLVSRQLTDLPTAHSHPYPPEHLSWMAADDTFDDDDSGIATCISPRPNRLVLIGPDRPHRIARVDQNAGARVRASVSGFFLRSE